MPSHGSRHGSKQRGRKAFASCLIALAACAAPRPSGAQVIAAGNLADLTLEQLSNIEVTIATRRGLLSI